VIIMDGVVMNKEYEILNISKARVGVFLMPMLFVVVTMVSLSGCGEKSPIPKEGDIVVWKQRSELIIKAKLGQRREHIITNPETDPLLFNPRYERFIGQFPIDYKLKPFPKFTEKEFIAFEEAYASGKGILNIGHTTQFHLMLNGVKAKATDKNPLGGGGIDDPNQVKVFIHGHGTKPIITKSGVKRAPYNTQQYFERELMKELDVSSKETKNGLDCYFFHDKARGKRCFGQSTYPSISGFSFYVSPDTKYRIYVTSKEFIYGGIKIQWFTDQKNIYRARDIDAAIWRLLEAWNISPTVKDIKH